MEKPVAEALDDLDEVPEGGSRKLSRRSRPVLVADVIKQLVVDQGLSAGDRLPSEGDLMAQFGMAKGTIREAMRILEAQGLIETKTGPGGGSFVRQVSQERARALLANYFYFKDMTIADIYDLRRILEPELVAGLAGRLPESVLQQLERDIAHYASPPTTLDDERGHHIKSLRFHARLARHANNVLLGFIIDFMTTMLSDITVNRQLYDPPNQTLWSRGLSYHVDLVKALRSGDADRARSIMAAHMDMAKDFMVRQEAEVAKRFMSER